MQGRARGFELFQGNEKVVGDRLAYLAADSRAHALCPPSPEPAGVEPQQLCQNVAAEETCSKKHDWRWHGPQIRHGDRAHRRVVDDKEGREPEQGEDEESRHGILGDADDGPQRARGHLEIGCFSTEGTINRLRESMIQQCRRAERGERAAERCGNRR